MDESSIEKKMSQVLELVRGDISSIRTGRATPALVEDMLVSVYGGQQKLTIKELATINVADSQTLTISPWDKSIIGDIRKGMLEANAGLNPSIDGEIIRISLPQMTTEDRQKYVKLLGTKLENGKIMMRQIRGDVMHDIKEGFEAKEITEDEKFAQEKRLQEITDKYIGKIEELGKAKEDELMQI
jgi:ribosome recycling factor